MTLYRDYDCFALWGGFLKGEPLKHLIVSVIVAGLVLFTGISSHAASNGIVNAVSYLPFPAGASISVQTLDDTEQNVVILGKFKSALKQNGYILADEGHLIMTIELHDEIGNWSKNGRSHIVEFRTDQGTSNNDDTEFKLNLFNSDTGGLLNKGNTPRSINVTPSQHQINIIIEDATNGRRLWEGWASADKVNTTTDKILGQSMVPVLIGVIGKTVNNVSFSIP